MRSIPLPIKVQLDVAMLRLDAPVDDMFVWKLAQRNSARETL
jgi:hypothetical protein